MYYFLISVEWRGNITFLNTLSTFSTQKMPYLWTSRVLLIFQVFKVLLYFQGRRFCSSKLQKFHSIISPSSKAIKLRNVITLPLSHPAQETVHLYRKIRWSYICTMYYFLANIDLYLYDILLSNQYWLIFVWYINF